MAAGLKALCDDRIHPVLFEPARLGRGRGRAHDKKAAGFEPTQKARLRKTEMKAHDLGFRLLHNLAHARIERGAVAGGDGSCRIDREFPVIWSKTLAPSC